jgi:spermidine/putrescine transport system permease protein
MDHASKHLARTDRTTTYPRRRRHSLAVSGWFLRMVTIFVYGFLYLPILIVFIMSFHPQVYLTFPLPSYSLRWYEELLHDELMIRSLLNSLWLGGLTAVLSAIIGTPCALALVRLDFPGKRLLNTFVLAPMIIPQIITGISLLILLNAIHIPRGYPYLIIGHVLLTLPFIVITVSSQLYGFPRELEEAALSMGATDLETFFEVTLPLIAPSIFAGMLFAFTVSFQEFVATQMWATPSTYTLPIRIFARIRDALTPEVNVVGVLTIAVSFAVVAIVQIMTRRGKRGNVYGI